MRDCRLRYSKEVDLEVSGACFSKCADHEEASIERTLLLGCNHIAENMLQGA